MSASWLESLTIDGVTIPAWRKIAGLGSPPPRQDVRDRAQRHGSIDRSRFYQPRLLEIEAVAVIAGDDPVAVWDALDALKGAFAVGSDHVIRFRRRGMPFDERLTGRVAAELKADVNYATPGVLEWSIALLCADPRMYADVATTARYSPTTSDGGVVFPLAFPLAFSGGAGTDGSVMTVTNAGNFPTPATYTVEGPALAGFSIVNESTGEAIVTTGLALAAGDSLVIDVDARDVTVAGTSRPDLIDAAQTTWFELGAGNTLLRLHGSGFSEDVTALTATFRDARI